MTCETFCTKTTPALNTRTFSDLDALLCADAPLSERLLACADRLRQEDQAQMPVYLRAEVNQVVEAAEKAACGDSSGLLQQFRHVVDMPAALAEQVHFAFTVVNTNTGPQASFLLYTLDRRTIQAHEVLRSSAFVSRVAARLGFDTYPPEVMAGRIQGAEVVAATSFVRYSWFTDFLYVFQSKTSATDGGVLFTNFADDLVEAHDGNVQTLFPRLYAQVQKQGLWTKETLRFASNIYFSVHDCLGHLLPYNLQHPTKLRVGEFLQSGFNEFQADMHSLWAGTAPEVRSLMLEVFTPEELAFYPVSIVLKRVCSYLLRGVDQNRVSGDLMVDNDARAALLLFRALETRGVLVQSSGNQTCNGFDLCLDKLGEAVNSILDECLAVERQIAHGAEAYAIALATLHRRYVDFDVEGQWLLPSSIRLQLERMKTVFST